jgi:PucR C-terminal helix-turn-helix domain
MPDELLPPIHHDAMKALAALLRDDVATMTDETEGLLHREHPELLARIDPAVIREGVAHTHARFVALLDGDAEDESARHVAFGAAMAGAGVSVEALLAGYRVGAQVGWRHVARHAAAIDAPAAAVLGLATATMSYMDELASNSLEGFARAAASAEGARARERQALLDILIAGRPDDAGALARAAGWPLPERLRVAVVLTAGALDERRFLLGQADGAALVVARAEDTEALLAEAAVLAVGPAVPPEQAPLSLARARRVAALVLAGVVPEATSLLWEDHLAELVVHADGAAGETLAAARLAPLQDLPPARERLLRETLEAWLMHPGRPREIAKVLHLHHQTVRYRLARLRERFGDELDDPAARFELALALRLSSPPAAAPPG